MGSGARRPAARRSPSCAAQLQERVDAMAMRLGQMNAHVIRLDALGKRLTDMANIDQREFDFDSEPPTGGPETDDGVSAADSRPHQHARQPGAQGRPARRPARRARERDPRPRPQRSRSIPKAARYQGRLHFLRTSASARIPSRATRPSTRASISPAPRAPKSWPWPRASSPGPGSASGYGSLVEINHGNGYITRYGHNQRTLVTVGQTVTRGAGRSR